MLRRSAFLGLAVAMLVLAAGTPPSPAGDKAPQLREQYLKWLEEVEPLLTRAERRAFLALRQDYQRDGFIKRFWEARDPYPETTRNEFQIEYQRRLDQARNEYGNLTEDRARTLLAQGPPSFLRETDCGLVLWPLEIWRYQGGGRRLGSFTLIFYQPAAGGRFRWWRFRDGFQELQALFDTTEAIVKNDYREFATHIHRACGPLAEEILAAVDAVRFADEFHITEQAQRPPTPRDTEWLETFRTYSTDLPADAEKLGAEVKISFPARDGARTVVQTLMLVPSAGATPLVLGERRSYTFLLTGEVLRDDVLFESFRYRFDLPIGADSADSNGTLPLAFDRLLRPGDYTLILRLEDQQSKRAFREERALAVPAFAGPAPEVAAALASARAELAGTEAATVADTGAAAEGSVRLLPLGDDLHTGPVRITAAVTGSSIARVTFLLDGKTALTKTRPPYEVELNLGSMPRPHQVRAVGLDAQGAEIAADSLEINAAPQRFTVRLLEPRGGRYQERLPARAEISVPDGAELDRLELYLNEDRIATLYQPPWAQAIPLPPGAGAGYVRAVAVLVDGLTTEDLALFNAPGAQAEMEVRLIELYAAVADSAGRAVTGLGREAFRVLEDGVEQEVLRFEQVRDLPIHLVLALDTSASMAKSLPEVQRAALLLLQRTITAKDRAALITFSDTPSLAVKFTNDLPELSTALARLSAERGTALYDALVFGLTYLRGVRGAQALVLLSDGSDRASQVSFEEAVEYARRSGVAVYTIGAQIGRANLAARAKLCKLAGETGGSCHFIEAATELGAVYAQIESELRSRYLLVYQPARGTEPGEFRRVEVRAGSGLEVKTIRGYYP